VLHRPRLTLERPPILEVQQRIIHSEKESGGVGERHEAEEGGRAGGVADIARVDVEEVDGGGSYFSGGGCGVVEDGVVGRECERGHV
jgi:hypothetical protein